MISLITVIYLLQFGLSRLHFGASEKRLKPLAAIRVNAAASMQQEVQLAVSSFAAYLHQASRKKGRSENRQASVIP